jgi:hypothetical protein
MTTAKTRAGRDFLTEEEMAEIREHYYEEGKPYLWTLGYGWAIVGFYVRRESGLFIVVQHANHFRNAGKHYGRIAREGIDAQDSWRYEGLNLVGLGHVLKVQEYFAEVPRGQIK